MKRLPLFVTIAAVAILSASLAYWGLQLFKPAQRAIAAAPAQAAPEPSLDAAKGLFGGETAVALASNYQLRGVVAAAIGRDSAAIVAVDGKPATAVAVGREVAPGVVVKEIHPKHVLLSEGGVMKRIELASDIGAAGRSEANPPSSLAPPAPPPPQQQQQQQGQAAPVTLAPAQPVRTGGPLPTGPGPGPGPERR